MATPLQHVREHGFGDFTALPPETIDKRRQWLMRAQNFSVEWIEFDAGAGEFTFESEFESLFFGVRGRLRVVPRDSGMEAAEVPADAVAIVPAGAYSVQAEPGAACALIASQRGDLAGRRVLNAANYESPDPRIVPANRPFRRTSAVRRIEVLAYGQSRSYETSGWIRPWSDP